MRGAGLCFRLLAIPAGFSPRTPSNGAQATGQGPDAPRTTSLSSSSFAFTFPSCLHQHKRIPLENVTPKKSSPTSLQLHLFRTVHTLRLLHELPFGKDTFEEIFFLMGFRGVGAADVRYEIIYSILQYRQRLRNMIQCTP